MKFTYRDNSQSTWELTPDGHGHWVAKVVCVIEADTITEADKEFKAQTGLDVMKLPHIGVGVEK